MAALDYRRKRKLQIYLLATLLLICIFTLSACNQNDGVYDVSGSISEPTHFMAKFMLILNNNISNFGWTVVAFTVILRVILMPLDIWQKLIARKNSKAMERMKPQLAAMQEKYKDDKERYQQEQMALYKKEKYSMMGSCLPTIVTMIVFFVVFAGFRQMVGFQFANDYKGCKDTYFNTYTSLMEDEFGAGATLDTIEKNEANAAKHATIVETAQLAVKNYYFSSGQKEVRTFLWIKNIFVPDSWKSGVPDFNTVTGQSGFATSKLTGVEKSEYNLVMGKVIGSEESGWGKGGSWNGWLLLPILSIALSFVSQKLMTKAQGTPPSIGKKDGKADQMQSSMKMMQIVMPIMIGVFALMYSGAFALYMFVSSLAAIVFQLVCTVIEKIYDGVKGNKIPAKASK